MDTHRLQFRESRYDILVDSGRGCGLDFEVLNGGAIGFE